MKLPWWIDIFGTWKDLLGFKEACWVWYRWFIHWKFRIFYYKYISHKPYCDYHGWACNDVNTCNYEKFKRPQPYDDCVYCNTDGYTKEYKLLEGVEYKGVKACPYCNGTGFIKKYKDKPLIKINNKWVEK